jgi:hypothetical protein
MGSYTRLKAGSAIRYSARLGPVNHIEVSTLHKLRISRANEISVSTSVRGTRGSIGKTKGASRQSGPEQGSVYPATRTFYFAEQ